MYTVIFSRQAEKDKKLLKAANLEEKARSLLNLLMEDPFRNPPPYEAPVGQLKGFYSRRINYKHRLVYTVNENEQYVHVLRMWTHYE